jgi:O-antigen ligase
MSFGAHRAIEPIGRTLALALASVSVAISVQLIPLPAAVVRTISPAATHALGTVPAPVGDAALLPLSLDPRATALGLTFVVTLSLFFIGVARLLRQGEAAKLAAGLAILGTVLAFIGIAEQRTWWPGVYALLGLALPPDSVPLGPFSSRNHYAGWMLMVFAITLGYFCGIVEARLMGAPARAGAGGSRVVGASWTPAVAFALSAMAFALIQTRSRAGILGLVAALCAIGGPFLLRITSTRGRMLVAAPLLLIPMVGVSVAGIQPIVERFTADSWSTGHGRLPIWRQALAIARDFPIAGSGFNTYQRVVRSYPVKDVGEPYEGAHNDFLQLALEGGLLVAIPAAATAGLFARQTIRRLVDRSEDVASRWIRTGAAIGLLLVGAQELVDFSLQVPGNAALFAVLAGIAIHHPETSA